MVQLLVCVLREGAVPVSLLIDLSINTWIYIHVNVCIPFFLGEMDVGIER